MEEKDFQRLEQLIGKAVKAEIGKAVKSEIQEIDTKLTQLRKDVNEDFRHQVCIFTEDFHQKLQSRALASPAHFRLGSKALTRTSESRRRECAVPGGRVVGGASGGSYRRGLHLVAEGHQMLSEKIERMHTEINDKVTAVAADLAAHRADTEGHKRGYIVKEP